VPIRNLFWALGTNISRHEYHFFNRKTNFPKMYEPNPAPFEVFIWKGIVENNADLAEIL